MNSGAPEQAGGGKDSRDKWITIDRLCDAYEASLQAGEVERAPFLAGVPLDWRDQLAHELDAIDAAYNDAKETREQTLKAPADDAGSRRLPTRGRLAELATLDSDKVWLGRFEIRKRLGAGATGSVWCARDARLARWVALKVPHATRVMSETTAARFQTEARAAAAITHPNVVQVHEVLIEDGLPILIQQWIDGPSLAKYLKKRGPLEFDRAADWMSQIADAVACAHDKGIVHRDLKPANVMLNKNRPMVLDFGLASYPQSSSGLTTEGTVLGTPAYMSPEQAEGNEHANQPPTDIYALGTMLYEMLVGTPPFVGNTREVLQAAKTGIPSPPRSHRAAIPRDLETITLRCLAKSPSARYRSAAELRDDLNRFRRREPIHARKVSAIETGWAWCRMHPTYALIASGAPLVVLLFLAMVASQFRQHKLSDRLDHQRITNLVERDELLAQRNMIQLARASGELSGGDRTRGLQLLRRIPEARRHWEWNLLDLVSHSPSQRLNTHVAGVQPQTPVTALAMAPNPRCLYFACQDGTVVQWVIPENRDPFPREPIENIKSKHPTVLHHASTSISAMAVSPNEKWIGWLDRDGTVTIWDIEKNRLQQQLERDKREPGHAISFSPNSEQLVVGGGSFPSAQRQADQHSWLQTYYLQSSGEFTPVYNARWDDQPAITGLQFVSNNRFASTRGQMEPGVGAVGFVQQWRIKDGRPDQGRLIQFGLSMRGLDIHADSKRIAWCDDAGTVFIKGLNSQLPAQQFQASHHKILQVRFSPAGDEVAVLGDDGGVSKWFVGIPIVADTPDESLAKTPNNNDPTEALTGDASNHDIPDPTPPIKLPTIRHIRDYHGHENAVRDALFIAPSQSSASHSKNRSDEPFLITCGEDGKVMQWSHATHQAIEQLNIPDQFLTDAAWVSDRQIVVSTSAGRRQDDVKLNQYTLPHHQIIVEHRHARWAKSIAPLQRQEISTANTADPDSTAAQPQRFAICCRDRILILETENNDVIAQRSVTNRDVGNFTTACLVDSRWLVAATTQFAEEPQDTDDKPILPARYASLILFDLQRGDADAQVRTLRDVPPINRIRLSPDRRHLVLAARGGQMMVLPAPGLNNQPPLDWGNVPIRSGFAHQRAVTDFSWLSSQGRLATVSADGTCAIWDSLDQICNPPSTAEQSVEKTSTDKTRPNAKSVQPANHRLMVNSGQVTSVSATSSGDRIVTVDQDRVIRIWDTFNGLELISLEPRKSDVVSVQFSPDDRYLMIADANANIEVIELNRGSSGSHSTSDAARGSTFKLDR
ncbi:WD40 repeat domain-containing serine/threonine-protein kinase [Stieleria sp. TO1_6]|uniref:WD40 repeat domain-containing serine/threonine protein kinase n=1 Tax=Stieleria tagensis TaxID=2956795 RepID=UPI00209A974F|nr:WD40 repeat domain-containing serine/threonine-protein kinase [Stieleria tagensis]MCO8121441.1 WD40 repeat domain-containing serine/threonine-protein kinase [Stieleria tagensis]